MKSRFLGIAAILFLALTTVFAAFVPVAEAQTPVVGTADFRNAPQLVDGTYRDRVVTGDSAWYSVVYTNETPYEFNVEIAGNAPVGVELTASFVAPTLTTVDGPAASVSGPGVGYPVGHTNLWFLKLSLDAPGQDGVEYPVTISVSGVQSLGFDECADVDGCTLQAEHDALRADLTQAQDDLAAVGSLETQAAVQSEIENLRGFAETSAALLPGVEGRLGQNEATMARLCAPEPMCETFPNPGTKTPMIGWLVGFAALIFGAYAASKKLSPAGDETAEAAAPGPPSAIDQARRQASAKRKADKKAKGKRS